MMQLKQPKKFTLIHQKDQNDLHITDWSNPSYFSSLVKSLFSLPSNSNFFLMDIVTNSIYDLAAFFSLDHYSSNTFQVIPTVPAQTQTPNKQRNMNGSQYGSSGAADFGGRESSPYYFTGGGSSVINASRVNSNNQIQITNPRASRSASYDLNQNFKYTNNNSAINSNTNNNTIMHFDDTPTNMSRVIHDFEAFMHDTVPPNYFCILFFDDQEQLKGFGNHIAKQITQPFPNFDVYYSLYPSKRSRGAFVPSDSPYLLQLYHQKEMKFERELSINEPVSTEIIDALGNYIKNTPKSSSIATNQDHIYNIEQHNQPSNFFNIPNKNLTHSQSQAYQNLLPHEFKSDESPKNNKVKMIYNQISKIISMMSQDVVFELVDVVCTSRFRDLFDDDEFKYILKQVKKKNPDLITAYQNFKLFNDEFELEQALKQAATKYDQKLTPAKIDVSFENKEKRSSLKKLKKGQKLKLINQEQDELINYFYFYRTNGSTKQWDLKSYKGIRKFLRDYNQNNVLTIEEASIIVYCAHPSNQNNKEFIDILDYLDNFTNPDNILKIFKAYGSQISQRIVVKYFEQKEAEQINSQKEDILSPICGAFMNLRALGNIDDFLEILIKNFQCFDQKDTSFSNNNPVNCQNIINNSNYNTLNSNVVLQKSAVPSTQNSSRDLYSNQQPPQYQHRMPRDNTQGSLQMESIPESNENQERYHRISTDNNAQQMDPDAQISLFAYSQIAKKKSGERRPTFCLGLNGNNVTRQRSDSRRQSTKVQNQDQQVIEIIDKFHQAKDQMEFDDRFFEALRKLRNNTNLNQHQDILCDKMYYNRYQEFIEILDRINNDINYLKNESNKQEIIALIQSKENDFNEEEEESPLSKSPKVKYRRDKYLKFKNVLNFLFVKTQKNINQSILILYHKIKRKQEELSLQKNLIPSTSYILKKILIFFLLLKFILIIQISKNLSQLQNQLISFISSKIISQQMNQNKQQDLFTKLIQKQDYDEIEQFDESTNKQLSILFYLKRYISQEFAQVYEKLIRCGDTILIDLYKQFKEKRNKQEFIQKVIDYAQQRKEEIQEVEQKMKEQKQVTNTEQQKLTTLIDTFHDRLMQDVHHVEVVYELIDNDNPIMKSISEVYDYTKDKQEMIQNVTLLYKHHFQIKLEEKTLQVLNELKLSRHSELKIKEKIKNRDVTLTAAFNTYLEDKDEQEFKESVKHLQY